MADVTITGLPNATTPLTGTERVPMDQAGVTVDAPVSAIAALAPATDLSYNAATRTVSSSTGTDVVLPLATDAAAGLLAAADKTRLDQLGADDSPSFAGLTITGTAAVSIPHIHGGIAGPSYIHCKSAHGSAMTKGTPVHIVSSVGDTDVVEVIPADAADPTKMPAVGLLDADVAPNGNGHVVVGGELLALNTAGYSQGEAAWVAAGGGLTPTRPTTGLAQQVATVGRVHATTGSVTVVPGTALAAAIAAQTATANVVLAGPAAGAAAAPTFRALVAADLPATAVAAATYGSASQVATFTVDAQGRLTFAGNVSISISAAAVSGLAAVATSGAYGDLSGRPTLFDPASPGAIGGTTPAAGSFTSLTTSTRLGLPSGAPASPAARDLYAVADTLRYRDSSGTERLILNATDNLSNLANVATARTNLGAAASGSIITSGLTLTSSRIVGRSSSGTGAPEEFSLTGLAFAGSSLATLADLVIPLSDEATALTVSTRLTMPYWPRASVLVENPIWMVNTAPTGAALQMDVRIGGTSIYSTLPTIAAGATNSTASAGTFSTAFVSGGQAIALGSSVTFHVTQIGSSTAGAGLKVALPTRRAG